MFTSTVDNQTIVIANQQGSSNSRYEVMTSISGLSLVIMRVEFPADQGVYTCTGSSNGETISASANINILCECLFIITGIIKQNLAEVKLQCLSITF